jgi:4-hydroxybenzoate polyprenyltransferase
MQKLYGFLKLVRAGNLFIIALGLSLFYYLVVLPVHQNILQTTLVPFSNKEFVLFVLSVILLAAGGNVINDYFDFELDKEFKPGRPLAQGLISLDAAMYLHMFFVFGGVGLGFYLGWNNGNLHLGYLYVVTALLLYVYSAFLKKIPLAGNLVVAGLSAFVFVLLLLFEADYLRLIHASHLFESTPYAFAVLLEQMKFYAGFAFATSLARELIKDIEDHEGDAAYKIDTFAVQYGDIAAKWLSVIIMAALVSGLGYYMLIFYNSGAIKDMLYLTFAVAVPVIVTMVMTVIAKQPKDYARISNMLKLIMLLGILSIPAFYLFHQTAA